MIIVHTASDNIRIPFNEMLLSLMMKCEVLASRAEIIAEASALLENYEDDHPESNILSKLSEAFGPEQYFYMRHPNPETRVSRALADGTAPFVRINGLLNEAKFEKKIFLKILSKIAKDFEDLHSSEFSEDHHNGMKWSDNENCLWLRTDRGFVTFAKKEKANDLIETLKLAIQDWKPSPTRMLSAKFRSELDNRGVVIEDKALSQRHVHAKFYDLIMRGTDDERKTLIDTHIDRHIEQLTIEVKDNVRAFGLNIVSADEKLENPMNSFGSHYGIDLSTQENNDKATNYYNSYISLKNVSGWHLTSGHIMAIKEERWICLSPACDMYPGQRIVGISSDKVGSIRPFIAAQLHKRKSVKAEQVQSNNFLFLSENRGGPVSLDSAPRIISGFLPGYAERGALRFCCSVGRA